MVFIEKQSRNRSRNSLGEQGGILIDAFMSEHDPNEVGVVDDQHSSSDPEAGLDLLSDEPHDVFELFASGFPYGLAFRALSA